MIPVRRLLVWPRKQTCKLTRLRRCAECTDNPRGFGQFGSADVAQLYDEGNEHVLYQRLKSYISQHLSGGSGKFDNVFIPLAIMAVGAGINFLMFVLIARVLSAEQFAVFAFWFSMLSLFAGIGLAGQAGLIFKNWNNYIQSSRFDLARGSFLFGTAVSSMGAFVAGLTAGFLQILGGGSLQLALSCAVFATVFTMIYFMSAATRAISGFIAGDGNMEITWRLFAVAAILACTASGVSMSVATIFWILSTGVVLALGFSMSAVLRSAPRQTLTSRAQTEVPVWRRRSLRIFLASIVANVSLHIDVLVIGIFVDPLLAGAYFVAMRVANVFKRLTAAFGSFASRRIAPLHFAGQHQKLVHSLRELSVVAVALVGGGLLFLAISAKWLLVLFGAPYASEVWTLLVLALGAGVTTLAGPAPELLLHTGHESRYLSLLSAGLVLRFAFLIALTPLYGTLGAAMASTAGALITAILLNIACKRAVGIDPSVASLFQQRAVKLEGNQ